MSTTVPVPGAWLEAEVAQPPRSRGVVLFAHGSGSSRFSPRNQAVAAHLNGVGLATVLLDLLTAEEDEEDRVTRAYRFDIPLLAERLVGAVDWVARSPELADLPVGCFGASTGAAAALIAAARRPAGVSAVVSRGGRPDLADAYLPAVKAPTLLIVGGNDPEVLALNRDAAERIGGPVRVEVVAGATHLFEEPGALDQVARLAGDWFLDCVSPAR